MAILATAAGPTTLLPTEAEATVAAPELDNLPPGVLTSRAWGRKWVDMHRELATRSRSSFHRITGDRSHNIHIRHATLVVNAIRDVAAARRQDHLRQRT